MDANSGLLIDQNYVAHEIGNRVIRSPGSVPGNLSILGFAVYFSKKYQSPFWKAKCRQVGTRLGCGLTLQCYFRVHSVDSSEVL